jgi:hypothetical protein
MLYFLGVLLMDEKKFHCRMMSRKHTCWSTDGAMLLQDWNTKIPTAKSLAAVVDDESSI